MISRRQQRTMAADQICLSNRNAPWTFRWDIPMAFAKGQSLANAQDVEFPEIAQTVIRKWFPAAFDHTKSSQPFFFVGRSSSSSSPSLSFVLFAPALVFLLLAAGFGSSSSLSSDAKGSSSAAFFFGTGFFCLLEDVSFLSSVFSAVLGFAVFMFVKYSSLSS
jgi:hypothetical protein